MSSEVLATRTYRRPQRGFSLLEVMVAAFILAIAITSALGLFITHVRGAELTEQRRIALQFAHAKIDELRLKVASGWSLELVYQTYGVLDYGASITNPPIKGTTGSLSTANSDHYLKLATGMGDPATFIVGEDANNNGALDANEDLNGNGVLDTFLDPFPTRPLGTVTFVDCESPNEGDYGKVFGMAQNLAPTQWYLRNPFGLDITGNGNYSDTLPSPFPLDINGDGDSGDTADSVHNSFDRRDNVVTDGFIFLPVVITIMWNSPFGAMRTDVFALIGKEHP